ncbi:Pre-mRNA-splicing factor SYF1 [Micractinium conductrix]|uniref:Pre-mRNA-splicing factor SYF1 n=1 Tax=Micractinium conductrix TaxID=554055 RepID=A0A2P6VDE0_9CHLO|nr:Pre-mRNA-splicing factor SYF1 [Micractinium conductrix]|eukprot:PSC72105.1 Pre-mRNA-splicing factor SYF1 [Micractinium conductrix]
MAAANGPAAAAAGNGSDDALAALLPDADDLLYEEELLRNPYALRMWLRYLDARKGANPRKRYLLFERAVNALPGSYKLWHAYLSERLLAVRGLAPNHPSVEALNNTFERAMVSMHKMPRIWIMYLEFVLGQAYITRTRRLFDRALTSLPVTQHERIWPLYLRFIGQPGIPMETAVRVYRRYLKLEPTHSEEFIAYLKIKQLWGEAARRLAGVVNDEAFRSLEGKSKHQLWLELCDLVTKHPNEVKEMKVEAILRSGIRRFTDEVGRLWTSLADYFIRRGMFERARDVYEEGLTSVMTVRDFSLVYDALTQFEESLISAKMEQAADEEEPPALEEEDDGEDFLLKDAGDDLDMRLARLEHLMERRPELLSSVMLRQNPHNVHEWHKRAKLFNANPTKQILCYTEAVKTVDADKAVGKPHTLWVAFAKLYERHGDLPNARVIFEKAVQARYKFVDDLATVWCEWAEMELRHKNFKRALDIMRRATAAPPRPRTREEEAGLPVQDRLYRSLKLWSFYVDLEESLGTLESTKAVYESILDLRIATPQIVLNYATFMTENKFFEEAFRVYERGISLFKYPHVKDIWTTYLTQFVARYGGKKVERARDMFRQAIDEAPADQCRPLFLAFAKYEEDHGLARNAMQIYDQAVKKCPEKERLGLYEIYVARASEFFGIGKVREVYESAIEAQPPFALTDADTRTLCMRYAALERRLGEVDRARAIFVHAASLAHPRTEREFWAEWTAFEVKHGNEDTFREMLRIKRSVAAAFSQAHFNTTIIDAAAVSAAPDSGGAAPAAGDKRKREGDDMAALEAAVTGAAAAPPALEPGTRVKGFVSAGIIQQGNDGGEDEAAAAPAAPANPEELDLAEEEEEEAEEAGVEGEGDGVQLEQRAVPDEVFGALKKQKTEAGYLITDEERDASREQFMDKFGPDIRREDLTIMASKMDDPTEQIFVFFPDEPKVGVKTIKLLAERMRNEGVQRAVMVTQANMTPFAKQCLSEMAPKYYIELFQEAELLVNITKHTLVPQHRILTRDEKQTLLDRYKVKDTQLPRIQFNDPVARYFGLQRGGVVRIVRPSETAGRYVTYRLCV